jgi:pimeloyl-ACP methyl ester carboxylesterase
MQIVFIHGINGSKRNFKCLEKYFPDTLSFDLPGFGKAEKPRVVYDKKFFIKFLEKKITKRSILVGHSMGAILAKEFALKHPKLVKKIILLSYPLQENAEKIREVIGKNMFLRMYLNGSKSARFICEIKVLYKVLLAPFGLLTYRKYFDSFVDYFSHTYNSESSAIHEVILKDDYKTLKKIKKKVMFISGQYDHTINWSLLKGFKSHIIPRMGHLFFRKEKEIAAVIKSVT